MFECVSETINVNMFSKSLVLHAKLKPYRPFGIQYAHTCQCMRPSFLTNKIELYHNTYCLGSVSSLQLRKFFGMHSVTIRDKNCFLKKRERMNEWVLIATCKQLVWSTRIGRNMPIWIPCLILGSGPGADLPLEVTGSCFRAIGTWSHRSSAYRPFACQASTSRLPEPTPLRVYRAVPQVPPPLCS